jgi:hypothetical protein
MTYCNISISNQALPNITLNGSTNDDQSMFLTDVSYTIPNSTGSTLAASNASRNGSMTYNVGQNALLQVSWQWDIEQSRYLCAASVQGSSEYAVSGFDDPAVTSEGESTAYVLTLYSTASSNPAKGERDTMVLSASAPNSGTKLNLSNSASAIETGVTCSDAFTGSNGDLEGCGGTPPRCPDPPSTPSPDTTHRR